MTADDPKALVRRQFDAVEANDATSLAALLAPEYRLHFDGLPGMDRAAAVGFFLGFLAAVPDVRHHVEDQIAEGDRVATRITVRGTHQGDLMGLPPTGKRIEIAAINVHHFGGGQITEQWVVSDALGMMQQLGAIPTPGGA